MVQRVALDAIRDLMEAAPVPPVRASRVRGGIDPILAQCCSDDRLEVAPTQGRNLAALSVSAGTVANRGAAIREAVREWLAAHGEDAIVASYRHRYAQPDPVHEALVASLATASLEACLTDNGG